MLGTAFMAGIGAAADTARATLENIPAKLEDDLKEMGVLYNAQNEKFNKSMAVAEANIANIERIASDFGMEAGVVNSVYAANGGDESKTREQLKNMIDTYGDQPIPTVPIAPTKKTTTTEQMSVSAAPQEAVSKNMFQDFAKLFRYYGPEQVLQEFAKKQNISVDRAQKILSGTFGDLIPEAEYKVKPSADAMLAGMEKVKEEQNPFSTDTASGQVLSNVKTVVNRVLNPDNLGQYNEGDVKFAQGAINNMITAMENEDVISMSLISGRINKVKPVAKAEDAKVPTKWSTLSKNTESLLGAVINNKDITYDNAKILQLSNAQATAIASGEDVDWEKVNTLFFDITNTKKIVEKEKKVELKPYQKTIKDLALKHIDKNLTKNIQYPEGKIDELSDALLNAEKNPDNADAWTVVNLLVKSLKPTFLEDEKELSKKEQIKSEMFYKQISNSPYYAKLVAEAVGDKTRLEQIAKEIKTKSDEFAVMDSIVLDGNLYAEDVVVGEDGQVNIFVKGINIGPGLRSELKPKDLEEANKNLNSSMTALEDVSFLMGLLKKYPNAYNIIGTTRLQLGNLSDIFGSITGVQLLDAQRTSLQQDAKQRMIGFVSNVKDRLFKDPRLSDQDLALVKSYIGIIENNSIGESAAQAALVGLERIFTTAIAVGLADTMPNKTIIVKTNGGINFDEDSVARDLLNKMVLASGISSTGKILSKQEYAQAFANNSAAGKLYQAELSALEKRAILATEAMYAFRTDRETYQSNYVTTGASSITRG